MSEGAGRSVVELRPEVVFLYEILSELTEQRIQVPRFQREFVWRPEQMTDLLDSINHQYPIGSLLVWETDRDVATLERLGPFTPKGDRNGQVGYLLDGHQRLMTLAAALIPGSLEFERNSGDQNGLWEMYWNVRTKAFQHRTRADRGEVLFPLTALLDTMLFLEEIQKVQSVLGNDSRAEVQQISSLARTFQSYRVPVIRIKQTGLSEAVEIFARLNSKGQSMTADQMVSALTYRQTDNGVDIDLARDIDEILLSMGERRFGEIDRGTVLRAILANLDEDVYRTDWTKLTDDRREGLQVRLSDAVARTQASLNLALDFLASIGVESSRLLPYGLQLVVLSAFFDKQPGPTANQTAVLRRWFWVSSFSAWFGGANPSRISALIDEFRGSFADSPAANRLSTFDLEAEALPYPLNFDMRSARARTLLLVMLAQDPRENGTSFRSYAIEELAAKGPSSVGKVFWSLPSEHRGNPANRLVRAPSAPRGALLAWISQRQKAGDMPGLASCGISDEALGCMEAGDPGGFIIRRQVALEGMEAAFQAQEGVTPSRQRASDSPIDTE